MEELLYVGMRILESAHPDLAASTDFLSRQWVSTSAGITLPSYTVSDATYVDGDINGTETTIEGLTNSSGTWVQQPAVNEGANKFGTGALTTFGVVTGAFLPYYR